MVPYTAFSVFDLIQRKLDRKDCKTALTIVNSEYSRFVLWAEQRAANPLRIRAIDEQRKPLNISIRKAPAPWSAIAILLIAALVLAAALTHFVAGVSKTSASRAKEGVHPQTINAFPEPRTFHSVED